MAFKTATVTPFNNAQNDNWKADAFINLELPWEVDGEQTKMKIGFCKLKEGTREIEDTLLKMFRENPEEAAERIKKALIITFREASAATGGKPAF